jgi:hypothetical protein
VTEADFNKVKSILLHARAFTLLGRDRGISLQVANATHLRSLIIGQLLRHLADPAGEEPSVLAEAFFGPSASGQQRDLVTTVVRSGTTEPAGAAESLAGTGAAGVPVARTEATPPAGTGPTPPAGTDVATMAEADTVTEADTASTADGTPEPASAEPGQGNGAAGSVVPAPRESAGQPLAVGQQDEAG